MKVKKEFSSKDGLKVKLSVSDASEAFLNTVRRLVMEEVPTLAVEDVEIRDNSSALYDEMIALRLGLLPIKTDLSSYSLPKSEDEVKERAASCTLQMTLKAAKKGNVLAEAIQSKDPKCVPIYGEMPVVKLGAKQKIDMTLWAVMGQGKNHIKWSPGLAWFSRKAELKVDNKSAKLAVFKDKFPPQIFDKDGKISEKKILELDLVDAVDRVCDEVVKVTYAPREFTLTLESWGQLTPAEILGESAKILAAKVEELEAQL